MKNEQKVLLCYQSTCLGLVLSTDPGIIWWVIFLSFIFYSFQISKNLYIWDLLRLDLVYRTILVVLQILIYHFRLGIFVKSHWNFCFIDVMTWVLSLFSLNAELFLWPFQFSAFPQGRRSCPALRNLPAHEDSLNSTLMSNAIDLYDFLLIC